MTDSPIDLLFTIKPLAPLHLGEDGELGHSADRIYSDTLWSALFTVALGKGLQGFVESLLGPHFALSSSFPIWENTHFWPKPFLRVISGEDPNERKQWRKVAYVSDAVFNRIVESIESPDIDLSDTEFIPGGCLLVRQEMNNKPDCAGWLYGLATTTGNIVDRLTNAADLFDRTDLLMNTAAGVRLGMRIRVVEDTRSELESTLIELGRRGIGGERSSGKGVFEVENIVKLEPQPAVVKGGRFMTLSLYHPSADEVSAGILENASYNLIIRGGWVDQVGIQKKRLRMLCEGSVVPALIDYPFGDFVDVRPDDFPHPVYRCGRAYPLFLEDS